MEPIDTDFDYVAQRSREANPKERFNWLYIFPTLGVLWVLYLTLAIVFQWPVTNVVGPVMSIMLLVLFAVAALLFWAMAPRAKRR